MNVAELSNYKYISGDPTILDRPVKSIDDHTHWGGDAPSFPQLGVKASTRLGLFNNGGIEDPFRVAERLAPLLKKKDARKLGIDLRDARSDNAYLLKATGQALMLQEAARLGIDYLAVTSHDYDAIDEVSRLRDMLDLEVELIPGREVTARPYPDTDPTHKGKHLIVLNTKKMPPFGKQMMDVIRSVHDQGGFVSLAHFGLDSSSYTRGELEATIENNEPPDAIEVYTGGAARIDSVRRSLGGRLAGYIPAINGMLPEAGANQRALDIYEDFRDKVGMSVGSDGHYWPHVGEAITVFSVGQNPIDAMRTGNIVVMERRTLAPTTVNEIRLGGRLSKGLEEMRQGGEVFDIRTQE